MTPAARLAGAAFAAALCSAAALAAAGCGSPEVQLLDPSGKRPLVNALDVDARDGSLLVTTNRGFFRVDPDSGKAREIRGLVRVGRRTSPVGRFLEILADRPGRLYGSGHPDQPETLPQFLGLMSSGDGGQTWTVVSRLGRGDLHEMVAAHGLLYAADAVLGALLVSRDGGKTFAERFTPPGQVVDLAVSPADPDVVIISLEGHMFRSKDQGRTWSARSARRLTAAGRGRRSSGREARACDRRARRGSRPRHCSRPPRARTRSSRPRTTRSSTGRLTRRRRTS